MNAILKYILVLFIITPGIAQIVDNKIVLIGNIANEDTGSTLFRHIANEVDSNSTIILLGDITDENGFSKSPGNKIVDRLNYFKNLSEKNNSKIIWLAGDRDWDNNGRNGLNKINYLEKYVDNQLNIKNSIIPSMSCPGPKLIEVSSDLVIIAINSQWFVHPFEKPDEIDTKCKFGNYDDFLDELEELIEDNEDKNILIAAHHPIYSEGQYFGKNLNINHLMPLYGTFKVSYVKNIGGNKHASNPRYQKFIHKMKGIFALNKSIVYASAHEHFNYILQEYDNYFVNSSISSEIRKGNKTKETKYINNKPGYAVINYLTDGSISMDYFVLDDGQVHKQHIPLFSTPCDPLEGNNLPVNKRFNPCKKNNEILSFTDFGIEHIDTLVVAGKEYAASRFKQRIMGSQYRDEWTTAIRVPFIDLKSINGGLKPYALGGGLQTISLKFKADNGEKYSFRQVNKKPEKSLSKLINQTIYKDIVKDMIASMHPYSGLVASEFMKKLNILHATPQLFVMPNDGILGPYKEEFACKLGTFEKKLNGKQSKRISFAGSDRVVKSNRLFKYLYENSNYRVDKKSYAFARVFDMWLGDWDRHEKNWLWARYDHNKRRKFIAVPKDRDHVFSYWTGLVPRIADKVVMNAEHFGYEFKNLTHLNFKGRWLDRQLGNELTLTDWQNAAQKLERNITREDIDSAFKVWPKHIADLKAKVLKDKLSSRKELLVDAVSKYYYSLAKEVDIIGSNKKEYFDIVRLQNNDIKIKMMRKNAMDSILYERLFKYSETEFINIYGLGGKDKFKISGHADQSILIRIIGGKSKDKIEDLSTGKGSKKLKVFDNEQEDQINSINDIKITTAAFEIKYNNHAFEYDALMVLPKFKISSGNGFGFGVDLTKINKGFGRKEYVSKYRVYGVLFSQLKANLISLDYWYNHISSKQVFRFSQLVSSSYYRFPYFYGIGSFTTRSNETEENIEKKLDFFTIRSKVGFESSFLRKSYFKYYLQYEYNDVLATEKDNSIFDLYPDMIGQGSGHYIGSEVDFRLDFRDDPIYPKSGSLLNINHQSFFALDHDKNIFNKLTSFIAQYQTIHLLTEITIAAKIGGIFTFGEGPFYHLSSLGSNSYLRGYTRNRFVDQHAIFYNIDARIHIGTWYNVLAPMRIGVLSFYDNGKVWGADSYEYNKWNESFGIGFYISPISDIYSFNTYVATSNDPGFYFRIQIGWKI